MRSKVDRPRAPAAVTDRPHAGPRQVPPGLRRLDRGGSGAAAGGPGPRPGGAPQSLRHARRRRRAGIHPEVAPRPRPAGRPGRDRVPAPARGPLRAVQRPPRGRRPLPPHRPREPPAGVDGRGNRSLPQRVGRDARRPRGRPGARRHRLLQRQPLAPGLEPRGPQALDPALRLLERRGDGDAARARPARGPDPAGSPGADAARHAGVHQRYLDDYPEGDPPSLSDL